MPWLRRALILALALAAMPCVAIAQERTVGVTAIIEHPALDATRRGLESGFEEQGLADLRVLFRSAEGRRPEAEAIAREFRALGAAVIVPISTPSAQAAVTAAGETPIVFAAVTDPVGAEIVDEAKRPQTNITGVSDRVPLGAQLDLIREILPAARLIGVIHNPSEANSRSGLARLRAAAASRADLDILAREVTDGDEIGAVASDLATEVDAFFVLSDNTVARALEALLAVAGAERVPVFASDGHAVARGALAAIGFDYFEIGRQTAIMVRRVLDGEPPGAIPFETARGTDLYLNLDAARRIGLDLPAAVVERATVRIGSG